MSHELCEKDCSMYTYDWHIDCDLPLKSQCVELLNQRWCVSFHPDVKSSDNVAFRIAQIEPKNEKIKLTVKLVPTDPINKQEALSFCRELEFRQGWYFDYHYFTSKSVLKQLVEQFGSLKFALTFYIQEAERPLPVQQSRDVFTYEWVIDMPPRNQVTHKREIEGYHWIFNFSPQLKEDNVKFGINLESPEKWLDIKLDVKLKPHHLDGTLYNPNHYFVVIREKLRFKAKVYWFKQIDLCTREFLKSLEDDYQSLRCAITLEVFDSSKP